MKFKKGNKRAKYLLKLLDNLENVISSLLLSNNLVNILETKIKDGYPKENSLDEALEVIDNIAEIKTNNTEMYAKKAVYSKKNNTIELFENVKVERGKETIIGDYGLINLLNDSYSVKSNNSKKVKIFMKNE